MPIEEIKTQIVFLRRKQNNDEKKRYKSTCEENGNSMRRRRWLRRQWKNKSYNENGKEDSKTLCEKKYIRMREKKNIKTLAHLRREIVACWGKRQRGRNILLNFRRWNRNTAKVEGKLKIWKIMKFKSESFAIPANLKTPYICHPLQFPLI